MNCLDCQEQLHRRLDRDSLSSTAEVEKHLAECVSCREQHGAARLLLEGIAQMAYAEPAPFLTRTIVAQVLADRRLRRRQTRWRVGVTVSLAASILLMALYGNFFMPPMREPVSSRCLTGALVTRSRSVSTKA